MAASVADALYDLLAADPVLVGLVGRYRGGPAIFTARPIPSDATMPYVIIEGPAEDTAISTLDDSEVGRRIARDILAFGLASGSTQAIHRLAERVRTVLHGASVSIDGFSRGRVLASGPIQLSADDDTYGRIVTAHMRLMR